jgi:hypothetical protein
MKKSLFFIVVSLFFIITAEAGVRSKSEAQSIANQFLSKSQPHLRSLSNSNQKLMLEYISNNPQTDASSEMVYYYVFNVGENDGFIIVGGDDRAKKILGYSQEGRFDIQSIPENLRYWLSCYETELKRLVTTGVNNAVQSHSSPVSGLRAGTAYAASINPLVHTIWDQGYPYNTLCPMIPNAQNQQSVTGCVATGTAQIMNYHKYPLTGTGSNSYVTKTNRVALNADFSSITFDWENMLDSYSEAGKIITEAQNNAVAVLMFSCGVACDMDYSSSSGAYTIDIAEALIQNFSYDENLQYYQRDYFSESEWKDMIMAELNAGRPVAYAGTSTEGGHFFVCDGYDSDGLFHFNWGWSAMSNGYYELSALDPPSMGIGGSSGGFNLGQEMIIGIQPPSSSSQPSYQINFQEPLSIFSDTVGLGAPFIITASGLFNEGVNSFTGNFGFGLFNPETGVLQYAFVTDELSQPLLSFTGWNSFPFSGIIPDSVTPGNYKLYLIYRAMGEDDWNIIRGKEGTLNHYSVTITDSQANFTAPVDDFPQLTVNSITLGTDLYQNETGTIVLSLTNSGGEYNSLFRFYLKSNTTNIVTALANDDPVEIASGETDTIRFEKTIPVVPGQYTLIVDYDMNNNEYAPKFSSFSTTLNVTVEATPTEAPVLTLTSPVSFPDPGKVNKEEAVLTANIKNTGGLFDDYVIAYVFPASGGTSLTYFGYQNLRLDSAEEKAVEFFEYIDLEPGQYLVEIYYWNSSANTWSSFSPANGSYMQFTLVGNETTGNKTVPSTGFSTYPNPATTHLYINATETVNAIRIMDPAGKQITALYPDAKGTIEVNVEFLEKGAYILRYETEKGVFAKKFFKR